MSTNGPILIAYDGSPDARHAVAQAAALTPGAKAVVVYVRHPSEGMAAHLEGHPTLERVDAIDASERDTAEQLAAEGAEYAKQRGLDAEPRVANATEAIADTIVAVADELDATLLVVGARGRRGLKSLLLGSVSHHIVHHTRRPTLIVPSTALATARREAVRVLASDGRQAVALL